MQNFYQYPKPLTPKATWPQFLAALGVSGVIAMIVLFTNLNTATGQIEVLGAVSVSDRDYIQGQISRIIKDDLTNPVCETWRDTEGALHGCLTDVQLESLDNITTYINE